MAMKRICMSQSVVGPLANWTKKQWNDATKWTFKADGSKFRDGQELKNTFIDLLASGKRVIPTGDCDNFDYQKGCQGHVIEG